MIYAKCWKKNKNSQPRILYTVKLYFKMKEIKRSPFKHKPGKFIHSISVLKEILRKSFKLMDTRKKKIQVHTIQWRALVKVTTKVNTKYSTPVFIFVTFSSTCDI